MLVLVGFSALFASGCNLIIGTEKREEEQPVDLDLVQDKDTEIITTDLCVEYCDEVMGSCSGENAVYLARASCINTCNALPPGEAAEAAGNTVECRLARAKSAASAPDEECVEAGPGGGSTCGSNCEAWCQMLEKECPTDFGVLADCMNSCGSIEDLGGFDLDGSYANDDIQCRLIHLGAVGGDPKSTHCGHARYIASENCVPAETGTPDCEKYCTTVNANCTGTQAVYGDDDGGDNPEEANADCLATCAVLPPGDLSDRGENTLGCRNYHSQASAQNPSLHCNHAGPTGDGHCGDASKGTGNCESYCTLYQGGCTSEFDGEFADLTACKSACDSQFASTGAAKNSLYTIGTATSEDGLQCRTYYAIKALVGDASACVKAQSAGTCN